MGTLRTFLLRYRALAFAVLALALAMRAIVPAGTMIGTEPKVLTIRICDDSAAFCRCGLRQVARHRDSDEG